MNSQQFDARHWVFYGTFVLLGLIYAVIALGWVFASSLSVGMIMLVSRSAPYVLNQLPLAGELVPGILAAVMAATAPAANGARQTITVLILAALVYLAYLHLNVFFSFEELDNVIRTATDGLDTEIASEVRNGEQEKTVLLTLQAFASSVRNFASVVFAAVIGLKFNASTGLQPKPEPAAVVPAAPAAAAAPKEHGYEGPQG
jgi:hypothetical protein